MFDPATSELISAASPLDGLDLNRLPQFLTEAFATVVAARLGAVRIAGEQPDEEWQAIERQLRRLADTYEALAIFLPAENQHRPACAFVAGSAHHTLSRARRLQPAVVDSPQGAPSISVHRVAPEVSASLLFLISGHQADASEAARAISTEGATPGATQLLNGIGALASGSGATLGQSGAQDLRLPLIGEGDYLERAADAIWHRLALAAQSVARQAAGLPADDPLAQLESTITSLGDAHAPVEVGRFSASLRLPLEGPYHLARLLRPAAVALLETAVATLPPPGGVSPAAWLPFVRHFSLRKPFLWRNHLEAIRAGFLQPGQSFALTFPTGAGKTTLTQLRVATELLRGRRVVYLVPTKALVDEVCRDLEEAMRPIIAGSVHDRFLEDFGELAGSRAYVQTPEQCLAFLLHEPAGHSDVGLLVVDECHQLSGEAATPAAPQRPPGRRPVDAMWAVVSILNRSPGSDVVLLSAMVRNGNDLARWLEVATSRAATVLDLQWKPTRQVRGIVAYEGREVTGLQQTLAARRRAGRKPVARDRLGLEATPVGLFCHTQVWDTSSTFAKFQLLARPIRLGVNDYWTLTVNRNEVGGRLLAAMAGIGMRPIVFSQRVDWTRPIANLGGSELRENGAPEVILSDREQALFAAAAAELGDSTLVETPAVSRVGIHHGLLLPSERMAMEEAFRRSGGLLALVATPTVAQGINLPAEAVIIAGDDRWQGDAATGAPETLAVHELLNAAGRAGRAGHFAHGVVIDIPGKIFSVEGKEEVAFSGLEHAMGLFGLPDQCLDVVDPVTQVIDRIAQGGANDDVSQYFVRRAAGLDDTALARVLGATLGNALRDDREARAVSQAALLRKTAGTLDVESVETVKWRELAALAGAAPGAIAALASAIPDLRELLPLSFPELLHALGSPLLQSEGMLFSLVDPVSADLDRVLPRRLKEDEDVASWERRWQAALEEVLPEWLEGSPVGRIGRALHRHRRADGRVRADQLGRRFALHAASGVGHGVFLASRVLETSLPQGSPPYFASWLRLSQGCVREGFDNPDKLLLFWHLRRTNPGIYPRVVVHQIFPRLGTALPPWEDVGDVGIRRGVVARLVSHGETGPP